jgi:hypothetical protein
LVAKLLRLISRLIVDAARSRVSAITRTDSPARTQSINLDPLLKAELAVTLSHRHNTLARVALVL